LFRSNVLQLNRLTPFLDSCGLINFERILTADAVLCRLSG
jgi:hypothetical protein